MTPLIERSTSRPDPLVEAVTEAVTEMVGSYVPETRTFIAEHGRIAWLAGRGTIYLDLAQAERLLDIFGEATGGAELFNQLFEAIADLTAEPIPALKPLTCVVRKLDPAVWGDAEEFVSAAQAEGGR